MNLLDLLKKARLTNGIPNGNRPPTTYQDSIVKTRNVRFPPNISPGAVFESFIRYEESGTIPGNRLPVVETTYMVTDPDEDFMMTENNDNLISAQEII